MMEYGGYLPIESGDGEYYENIEEKYIERLNAARYAIGEAYKMSGKNRIWVPIYLCDSVSSALRIYGADIRFYNIDSNFMPILDEIDLNDIILVVNYYGQKTTGFYHDMVDKYKNIIFDNTQAFFQSPIMSEGVYNVYSPKKFVGVADGAYLIGQDIKQLIDMKEDLSSGRSGYLFTSLEKGTNSSYSEYLDSQQNLEDAGARKMSVLTRTLLSNVNYLSVMRKRIANYEVLCNELSGFNEIKCNLDIESPAIYPLLIKSDKLREKLITSHIYVSQWWKKVIDDSASNDWEKYISRYLFPLPIDQRYTEKDMRYIADVIKENI